MSKEILQVNHPDITLGQLDALAKQEIVNRSSHVGNQNLRELLILTNLEVRHLLADTIKGDDRYSKPAYILNSADIRLASQSASNSRVPSRVPIREDLEPLPHDEFYDFVDTADSLQDVHMDSLKKLALKSEHVRTVTELLRNSGERGQAIMQSTLALGGLRRYVASNGKVKQFKENPELENVGIFGINDRTPETEGAMIPLPAMMALDIIESTHESGTNNVYHLGGNDMSTYTRNEEIMASVGQIVEASRAELGFSQEKVNYSIINVSGLGRLASAQDHGIRSQYDLIEMYPDVADRRIQIDPENYDKIV